MKEIKKKLLKEYGKKCKSYSPFCFVCIVYNAVDVLEEALEIVPKNEIKRKK
jgi:hypothetical protein